MDSKQTMALGLLDIIAELAAEVVTLQAILAVDEELIPDWRERLEKMLPRGVLETRALLEPARLLCDPSHSGDTAERLIEETARRLIQSAKNPPPAEG